MEFAGAWKNISDEEAEKMKSNILKLRKNSTKELMEKYFKRVFMFGMNDEVLHTGYPAMCHYIFGMGVGPK